MREKYIEFYNLLPSPIKEKAIANLEPEDKLSETPTSLDWAVWFGFVWTETEEGVTYWATLYDELVKMKDVIGKDMIAKGLRSFLSTFEGDAQVRPQHYKTEGKEVWEMMIDVFGKEAFITFCKVNAFKYRMRAGKKHDNIEEDIKKALWYEKKIEELS